MNKRNLWLFLFILIIVFIWSNSMISPEISGEMSHFVAVILGGSQEPSVEEHFLVRKMAHFLEFFALGVTALVLVREYTDDKYRKILFLLFTGVFVPLVDETIQIFSARGPLLTDIWIDVGGFTTGSFLALGICLIIYAFKRKKGVGKIT